MEWIKIEEQEPTTTNIHSSYAKSENILATDGERVYLGYMLKIGTEDNMSVYWKVAGPEIYTLEDITHWQPLPKLPS